MRINTQPSNAHWQLDAVTDVVGAARRAVDRYEGPSLTVDIQVEQSPRIHLFAMSSVGEARLFADIAPRREQLVRDFAARLDELLELLNSRHSAFGSADVGRWRMSKPPAAPWWRRRYGR